MNLLAKQQNRTFSLGVAFVLLASLCLSVFFAHAEFDHDCTGEDCPICAVIQIARTNLQNLDSVPNLAVQNEHISFVALSFLAAGAILILKTPVSEKIKLNN
ncbi:MAG: hypothetical protein IJ558_12970 [Treponema sp.]|nr:hypothetical protein [Treponema sp.]